MELNLGSAYAYGIVVDGNGNTYVTGNCNHTWNGPGTPGPAPLHAFTSSDYGMFVLKLDTNGAYQWHTFYGSGGANAIALDGGGGLTSRGPPALRGTARQDRYLFMPSPPASPDGITVTLSC